MAKGIKNAFKKAGQKLEQIGRDIRDSDNGQRVKEALKDARDDFRDFFNRDDVKAKLKSVEHTFREIRDKVVDHFKGKPNEAEVKKSLDNMQQQVDELENKNPEKFEAECDKILKAMKSLDSAVPTAAPTETVVTSEENSHPQAGFAGEVPNNTDTTPDL